MRVTDLVRLFQIELFLKLPKVLGLGFGLGVLELMFTFMILRISYLEKMIPGRDLRDIGWYGSRILAR